jgi:AraC-like DNA-binding protein
VQFGQSESSLTFDERFLDLTIRRGEGALRQFLRRAPSNILVRYRQDTDLVTRIRTQLGRKPPTEWPAFDVVAHQMRLSSASLRRRLALEGQTFQQIKDQIRRELAIEWLKADGSRVGEVSARLGFNEPSAFHRAFRKWTGHSPGAFRGIGRSLLREQEAGSTMLDVCRRMRVPVSDSGPLNQEQAESHPIAGVANYRSSPISEP